MRLFRQSDEHTCGVAVLKMVLAHYGIKRSFSELCEDLNVYTFLWNGTTPWKLKTELQNQGLKSKLTFNSNKCSAVNLVLLSNPLHWVVWYCKDNKWKEYDPNQGVSSNLKSNKFCLALAVQ